MSDLILTGDDNTPAMPMTEAQVNHLRRLLAWMRCEYMLDEHMQAGFIQGASECVERGFSTTERASEIIQKQVDRVNHVPAYVRQGVKMLTKAIRDHEKQAGIVDAQGAKQ